MSASSGIYNRDIDRDFHGVCEQIDITIQTRLQDPLSHLR